MPPRISPSAASFSVTNTTPSIQTHCKSCLRRAFSSTPKASQTKLREQFWLWLRGPGENFRYALPGSTNYLSAYDRRGNLLRGKGQAQGRSVKEKDPNADMTADEEALQAAVEQDTPRLPPETEDDLRPFPQNKSFMSQSILSEDMRNEIWERVQLKGKSVRQVSIEMGVDLRRVAAVVRLVEVEKRMKAENKPLAIPYARAVHSMVPLTTLNQYRLPSSPHESINDLEQHPSTYPQLFYPTSESRAFNRTDAGRVFSGAPRLSSEQEISLSSGQHQPWKDTKAEYIGRPGHVRPVLKPADSRIPNPQMIAFEQDKKDNTLRDLERRARHTERLQEDAKKRQLRKEMLASEEEEKKTRVDVGRWQFVVTEVESTRQGVGLDGRGSGKGAVGQRYGVPSQERKKGRVKIPTKVEV